MHGSARRLAQSAMAVQAAVVSARTLFPADRLDVREDCGSPDPVAGLVRMDAIRHDPLRVVLRVEILRVKVAPDHLLAVGKLADGSVHLFVGLSFDVLRPSSWYLVVVGIELESTITGEWSSVVI